MIRYFRRINFCKCVLSSLVAFISLALIGNSLLAGPLERYASNPRYFTDGSGRAVFLTGSHTWSNFQDVKKHAQIASFDYATYLDFIKIHGHNFIRMWTWEQAAWAPWTEEKLLFDPPLYQRTGPGKALDGGLKFDLTKFNQAYIDGLRSRVIAARDRGIYVSIMLFQGWSIEKKGGPGNPWPGHPFNINNNINGIDGDANGDWVGSEVHTLLIPEVVELQEAYVRKVIDTVNDHDNVMYEISNESSATPENKLWQYHFIQLIKGYEAKKAKQHPVLMTYRPPAEDNHNLFASLADAISPGWGGGWKSNADDYRDDPPAADGSKVIISDTDHLWGIGGNHQWVWKSFLRGLNPIFMDPYLGDQLQDHPSKGDWELARKNMGYTLAYSLKIDLSSMTPKSELSSTTYCLADPGNAYLIFLPAENQRRLRWFYWLGLNQWFGVIAKLCGWNESAIVDLSASSKVFRVEWFNPRNGETSDGVSISGGGKISLTSPFVGDTVLYIYKQ